MASVALLAATTTTVQADIVWTTGAPGGTSGGALFFDGSEGGGSENSANGIEFLETGIGADIIQSDYTVSFWLNLDDAAQQQYAVGTTNRSLHLGVQGGDAFQGHWGSDHSGSSADIVSGTWFHSTYTYDADGGDGVGGPGLGTIFINGVEIASLSRNAPFPDSSSIILGARFNNSGDAREHLVGSLDDVAFFNSVLTDSEIADLADGTTDALALGAGAYYDFEDDQTGTTAAVQAGAGVTAFGSNLTGVTATAIPEPSSLVIMLGLGVAGLARRKRS